MKRKAISFILIALILVLNTVCYAAADDIKIVLTIDSDVAYVNGKSVTLLAAPVIIGDSTMIPVRFISEQFGMKVSWNGETNLITITSK